MSDIVLDTNSITREQKQWLESEARRNDLKKSQLVRKIFAEHIARSTTKISTITPATSPDPATVGGLTA